MQKYISLTILCCIISALLPSCIGTDYLDDFVQPGVRITNPPDTIKIGTNYAFEAAYYNGVGIAETTSLIWSSSDSNVISINEDGLSFAENYGEATITVSTTDTPPYTAQKHVVIGDTTVLQPLIRTGTLISTSSYALEGDVILHYVGSQLVLELDDNYHTSDNLPGLYVYLTNNPSTNAGAFEIGPVEVFDGSHSYNLPESVQLFDYSHVLYYCAPFNVKVGECELQP
ncbi:MAG: DM13 domain-containing protein [Flavobacteriales bacterium]|nr:DM13 domain-containing protein [Flavobacteriales bacterium]